MVGFRLTQKDLRKEMEEGVPKKSPDCESYHYGKRGRIYVGWAESQEEIYKDTIDQSTRNKIYLWND